jgi:hypothetical protein
MAQLDIKGFVTPEQDLGLLNEFTKNIAAQNAAKAKAETKKSNITSVGINEKDYLTGTVLDPIISENMSSIVEKGYQFIKEHPNATQLELEINLSPYTRAASLTSQKLKVLKQQQDEGLAYLKTLPGADPVKFLEAFNKNAYHQNDDGTYPKDMSGIDETKNYVQDIIENAPIWNFGAVDALVKGAGANKSKERVSYKDKKGAVRDTEIEVTSPLHMKPILDKDGHFTGDFEMPHVLYMEDGQVKQQPVIDETTGKPKLDAQNNPITEPVKMLTLDDWETVKTNEPAYRFIKQEIRKNNLDPETPAGQNFGRAIAFKAVNSSAKAKTGFSEIVKQVEPKAPIIKNTTIVNNANNTKVRDLYTDAANIYSASPEGKAKSVIPLEAAGFDIEFVNAITDLLKNRKYKDDDDKEHNYDAGTMAVKLNNKGKWEVYSSRSEDNNKYLGSISKTSLNWDAQSGAKPRQNLLTDDNGTPKSSALDAYPTNVQYAITEYANSQNITIAQAIKKLKKAKKI